MVFKLLLSAAIIICIIMLSIALLVMRGGSPPQSSIPSTPQVVPITRSLPSIDHVIVVMMENKSYNDIVNNASAPYSNQLIRTYALSGNYYAVSHPSLPNYLAILGGSTYGVQSDCADCFINAPNLVDRLEGSHKTWKAYMESLPSTPSCFVGSNDQYAQKHNPFIYFDDIRKNFVRCQNIVPYEQIYTDIKSEQKAPNFMWISPNLCHDMHDCSVETGDSWLAQEMPKLLHSPLFTIGHSLLIITFDEAEGSDNTNNKVATMLIGEKVKGGYNSPVLYTHYSLLHTIESLWNLPSLTSNDGRSSIMSEFFVSN